MERKKIYLKTIFCCMACDGEIAKEEIEIVKQIFTKYDLFANVDIEACFNTWIVAINKNGVSFLKSYLDELSTVDLSLSEQMLVIEFAVQTIEADKCIEYSEIRFFKKIRNCLTISDEDILEKYPDKEEYLLPDVNAVENPIWNDDIQFAKITLRL